jgi:hypothetical protein
MLKLLILFINKMFFIYKILRNVQISFLLNNKKTPSLTEGVFQQKQKTYTMVL